MLGAVLPHPPVLLGEIGRGHEREAQATLDAYGVVAGRLHELEVSRLLMISTHGIVTLNRFHILAARLSGNMSRFDAPDVSFGRDIDHQLTDTVSKRAAEADVPLTAAAQWEESDHSLGVPLRLLEDAVPDRIAVVGISFRRPEEHLRFGKAISAALSDIEEPTAVLASGDAVHTLSDASAYGHHRRADEVQQQYESALRAWDPEALCAIDEDLRREVDESVISSTLILMGALHGSDANPHILASEHHWGVGYVTSLIEVTPSLSPPFGGRC
ncbi:MAG: class III extradiol dioxygenase subunit B-like domain-containing protein [Chloroflexi bacterium]|nr:class III extradiol dioxygenase subunit B-like domain-containing protein [Chloroflexota bacterium]